MSLLIEYLKALGLVLPIFLGVALAMLLPAVDDAVCWGAREVFELAAEYRWATITLIALGLAGLLVAEQRYAKGGGV